MGDIDIDELFSAFDDNTSSKKVKQSRALSVKLEKSSPIILDLFKDIIQRKRSYEDDDDAEFKKLKVENILDDINPEDFSSKIRIHVVETVEACLHE
ncbi:exosome RNA helicase MTR4, partial [Caerostris darwini]